jgi:hypothetical protein
MKFVTIFFHLTWLALLAFVGSLEGWMIWQTSAFGWLTLAAAVLVIIFYRFLMFAKHNKL